MTNIEEISEEEWECSECGTTVSADATMCPKCGADVGEIEDTGNILKKMNELFGFGFGIIDKWVFIYAASNGICGIGAGIFIASYIHTWPKFRIDAVVIISFFFMAVGLIMANIAHSILKKRAKEK